MLVREKLKVAKKSYSYLSDELFRYGLINLDKPAGIKCRAVVQKLRDLLEVPHIGYAGTLDPMVTGTLVIGLGKATKLLGILSKSDKTYVGTMHFHDQVSRTKVVAAFKYFTGKIEQMPPKLSAVKRVLRKRTIYKFKLTNLKERNAEYEVHCEAGTYIRKLCHDVGKWLGVGAHMTSLRRTQSGLFKVEDSVTFDEIAKQYKKKDYRFILSPKSAVVNLPKVWIDNDVLKPLSHGSPIYVPGILQLTDDIKESDKVAVFDQQNRLVSIGISKMDAKTMHRADRGTAIRTDVVLI